MNTVGQLHLRPEGRGFRLEFSEIIDEGEGGERMVVALEFIDGTYLGSYQIEAADVEAWATGQLSEGEMLDRILQTLEPANDEVAF